MRIAIIGAGIAGVTSAFELATDGHQVTVFDRAGSVAAEGSFANTGLVTPALALPWAAPGFPAPGAGMAWRWRRWRAGHNKAAASAQDQLLALAGFSLQRVNELRRSMQMDYERAEGLLVLLRTPREPAAIEPGLERLKRLGIAMRPLDADQCRAAEPGLNPETPLLGGVMLQQAEVGNCRQFAHQLRLEAQRLGVQFRFHTTVRGIEPGAPARLVHEYTAPSETPAPSSKPTDAGDTLPAPLGPITDSFDAIVVCAAGDSAALLRPHGIKLKMSTQQTCAITAPLRQLEAHPDLGPRAGLWDQQQQVAISHIGQRVRVVGRNEKQLHKVFNDWFPGAMQAGQVQCWSGAHATLPDAMPLLGTAGLAHVWLNIAHADAGWTLACGAARVLAEQVAGLSPGVDVSGLGISRLG